MSEDVSANPFLIPPKVDLDETVKEIYAPPKQPFKPVFTASKHGRKILDSSSENANRLQKYVVMHYKNSSPGVSNLLNPLTVVKKFRTKKIKSLLVLTMMEIRNR